MLLSGSTAASAGDAACCANAAGGGTADIGFGAGSTGGAGFGTVEEATGAGAEAAGGEDNVVSVRSATLSFGAGCRGVDSADVAPCARADEAKVDDARRNQTTW